MNYSYDGHFSKEWAHVLELPIHENIGLVVNLWAGDHRPLFTWAWGVEDDQGRASGRWKPHSAMKSWIAENVGEYNRDWRLGDGRGDTLTVKFRRKDHAMLFRLTWEGA